MTNVIKSKKPLLVLIISILLIVGLMIFLQFNSRFNSKVSCSEYCNKLKQKNLYSLENSKQMNQNCNCEIRLSSDKILINKFYYSLTGYPGSHSCRTSEQYLKFDYNNTSVKLSAKSAEKGPVYEFHKESYNATCTGYGTPLNLFEVKESAPELCSGKFYPENGRDFVELNCRLPITLKIINQTKFINCLDKKECSLVHGRDMEVLYVSKSN